MKHKILALLLALLLAVTATAASAQAEDLHRAPTLTVRSGCNTLQVRNSSAPWSWVQEDGSTCTIAIDAMRPLSGYVLKNEGIQPSSLPSVLHWDVPPDRLTFSSYNISDVGNNNAEVLDFEELHYPYIVNLKPGRIYDLYANWDESHIKTDGFCGSAEYVFHT